GTRDNGRRHVGEHDPGTRESSPVGEDAIAFIRSVPTVSYARRYDPSRRHVSAPDADAPSDDTTQDAADGTGHIPEAEWVRALDPQTLTAGRHALERIAPMIRLAGGPFFMGDETGDFADQRPRHEVWLDAFEIDKYEVTNRQFLMFVEATAYRTVAERRGWSYVFDFRSAQWIRKVGACWFNPLGTGGDHDPKSLDFRALLDHPVVHVSWNDAVAFCLWAGKRLPTEAEAEYAAKAGRIAPRYPWGERRRAGERFAANYWQGLFPRENSVADGFLTTAPFGSFPESSNGLCDLGGNVAEWCHDRYSADYYRLSRRDNPTGPGREESEPVLAPLLTITREKDGRYTVLHEEEEEPVERRCVRGGSFLSAENNGAAYRVGVRGWQPQTLSYQDLGFRAVRSIRER
ncbi:MAG TPA: hypothetical protein DEB39_10750, partial [Planctomycetaceae bacterium]|nr:hypothetical protein [Planctomycetaceae bacterium]